MIGDRFVVPRGLAYLAIWLLAAAASCRTGDDAPTVLQDDSPAADRAEADRDGGELFKTGEDAPPVLQADSSAPDRAEGNQEPGEPPWEEQREPESEVAAPPPAVPEQPKATDSLSEVLEAREKLAKRFPVPTPRRAVEDEYWLTDCFVAFGVLMSLYVAISLGVRALISRWRNKTVQERGMRRTRRKARRWERKMLAQFASRKAPRGER
jgi:hypothetical protein